VPRDHCQPFEKLSFLLLTFNFSLARRSVLAEIPTSSPRLFASACSIGPLARSNAASHRTGVNPSASSLADALVGDIASLAVISTGSLSHTTWQVSMGPAALSSVTPDNSKASPLQSLPRLFLIGRKSRRVGWSLSFRTMKAERAAATKASEPVTRSSAA
jgi:hypothetical protein